jgi:two-component system chemotaxis response regulator CheY
VNAFKPQCPDTVLLVEEDKAVRDCLVLLLSNHGLLVRQAASGAEAVELYRMHTSSTGVVLLDVGMQGMDGPQTLSALQQIDPRVRCCFMTGGAGKYDESDLVAMGAVCVFHKPFGTETACVLAQLVQGMTPDPSSLQALLAAHAD